MNPDAHDEHEPVIASDPSASTEAGQCPRCHRRLPPGTAPEFCPFCLLQAVMEQGQSGDSLISEEALVHSDNLHGQTDPRRFGHYEVLTDPEGGLHEIGRGAMGVTFKAIDLNLRIPVALKVLSLRLLQEEPARRRFLREARSAATVRHPNVASVYHLGSRGAEIFYAMEFVEGETLESLLGHTERLDVDLALEIATQIAAGLAAVHQQDLIHRDIKPANIIVRLDQANRVTAKIIDLGLAKAVNELHSAEISVAGGFIGTPAFASPEQFKGIDIDIRSDLYSLGVTLWDLLAGQPPFRGSLNELMYKHQRASPPLEQLQGVPQPVRVLLEVLLSKDPAERFQTPDELLTAIAVVRNAIDAEHRVRKTIRVVVSYTGDVQKERNLADRAIRSIAGEFNVPVIRSGLNVKRLVEDDDGPKDSETQGIEPDDGSLVLCPCFRESEQTDSGGVQQVPDPSEFDLVACIVWARLGTPRDPTLKLPDGGLARSQTEFEVGWALEHARRNRSIPQVCVYRNCARPTPPLEPKEEREAFGREWDAVQDFFRRWEENSKAKCAESVCEYSNLEEFEEGFRERFRAFLAARLSQEGSQRSNESVRRWASSPFRGLDVFDFEHAPIFHGRTKAIGEVLDSLEAQNRAQRPFILVLGASGSGKSSLLRAGVLPLLTQPETIEGVGFWRRAVTRPGAGGAGGDCFDALAAALLEPHALAALADPESPSPVSDLADELREHPDSVALRLRDALDHAGREWKIRYGHYLTEREQQLRDAGRLDDAESVRYQRESLQLPRARLALVLDQLEELFTSGFSSDLQRKYVSAIAGLVRSGRVIVLAALRSDFYPSYQEFSELVELTRPSGKFDLRPPTPYEIGNMIRLPAEAAGLHFEQDRKSGQRLDEALRDAAAITPESLPLLQHVLSLLYDKQSVRGDGLLRWSDYRELGELKGALARHAEAVFRTLRPDEQEAFPLVMRYLVTLGQGEEEVPNRRTVPYNDLVTADGTADSQESGTKGFVDLFIEKRLLVADTGPQGEVTVSVAHEALLREWQRVRDWLSENREFLRMRDRLDSSLKLWLSRGRQNDDLLGPGLPLAEGEKLVKDFAPSLSQTQSDYVYASIAEQKQLQRTRERIRYSVMAGILAALVVAIIFGVVSFRQYKRAERAKILADHAAKRATLARNDAGKLINYMTIDLRDKLRPIGRLDLLYDVNRRVLDYFASLGSDTGNPDILSQWSTALANSGDIKKDRGDLPGALKSYSDSLDIRERLARQNSDSDDWQRYRALGIANVADVLNLQGDSSGALERYGTALNILKELVARQPGNAGLRHDLSMMHENISQVLEKRGDLTHALQGYQDCLAIRQELKKQEPGNIERDHDISLVLLKIGRVFSRQGSLHDAVNSYQESLVIQQKLANAEPTNVMWQQELSSSKDQFGNGLSQQGDLVRALAMYRESLQILQRLTERDPTNANWQRLLARIYSDLSDVLISQGDLARAFDNSERALEIRDVLAKRDPSNANAQRDLALANDDLGKVLELQGNESGAKEKYNVSLSISRKLAAQDPNNAEWQRDLSISLERVGTVLITESDFSGASDKYAESLAIRKKLALRDKSNTQWQNDLSWSYMRVGDLLYAKKDMEGALTNYRTAQALERELVRRDVGTLELQSDLAVTCQEIGDILSVQGHYSQALDSYRECMSLGNNLVRKDPTNGEWASGLAFACYSAAITLSKIVQEPNVEMHTLLERARDILVKLQTQSTLSPVDERHLQDIKVALGVQ